MPDQNKQGSNNDIGALNSQSRTDTGDGLIITEQRPIDKKIPFNRSFIRLSSPGSDKPSKDKGLMRSFRKNVKGIFETSKVKGIEKKEIIKLRKAAGDLKEISKHSELTEDSTIIVSIGSQRPKSKKELLESKRQSLQDQSKEVRKKDTRVGIRLEIDKLKKKFPSDYNLALLSAILTAKDSYSPHRSANDRIASLYRTLQEAGSIVIDHYLTTYSVDVVLDIYFLYLDVLNAKLRTDLKVVKESEIEGVRRDIRVLNVLLEQKRFKKSVSNVVTKFNGFGYPFVSLSPPVISRSFTVDSDAADQKIGPGTVKLNKFLTQFYLSVFAQIPAFQPLAKKLADSLPRKRESRPLITAVNLDNAITNFRIAKANEPTGLKKKIMAVYLYGEKYIGNRMSEMTNPLEARILIKTAQMVDELAHLGKPVDEEIVTYGYNCACVALPYLKNEATLLTKKISEIADRQKIKLHQKF